MNIVLIMIAGRCIMELSETDESTDCTNIWCEDNTLLHNQGKLV